MEELRDIKGLDLTNLFAWAIGWQIVAGFCVIALIVALIGVYKYFKFRKSWKYLAQTRLTFLAKNIDILSNKQIISTLNTVLRYSLIQVVGREQAASIKANKLLDLLEQHDHKKFDWSAKGAILLKGPYQPNIEKLDKSQILQLILASKRWINVN